MALARDGSHGVLTVTWRRVEIDGALYVAENAGGAQGQLLWGPIPDIAACTALIRERAAFVKAQVDEHAAHLRARFGCITIGKSENPLGDDADG